MDPKDNWRNEDGSSNRKNTSVSPITEEARTADVASKVIGGRLGGTILLDHPPPIAFKKRRKRNQESPFEAKNPKKFRSQMILEKKSTTVKDCWNRKEYNQVSDRLKQIEVDEEVKMPKLKSIFDDDDDEEQVDVLEGIIANGHIPTGGPIQTPEMLLAELMDIRSIGTTPDAPIKNTPNVVEVTEKKSLLLQNVVSPPISSPEEFVPSPPSQLMSNLQIMSLRNAKEPQNQLQLNRADTFSQGEIPDMSMTGSQPNLIAPEERKVPKFVIRRPIPIKPKVVKVKIITEMKKEEKVVNTKSIGYGLFTGASAFHRYERQPQTKPAKEHPGSPKSPISEITKFGQKPTFKCPIPFGSPHSAFRKFSRNSEADNRGVENIVTKTSDFEPTSMDSSIFQSVELPDSSTPDVLPFEKVENSPSSSISMGVRHGADHLMSNNVITPVSDRTGSSNSISVPANIENPKKSVEEDDPRVVSFSYGEVAMSPVPDPTVMIDRDEVDDDIQFVRMINRNEIPDVIAQAEQNGVSSTNPNPTMDGNHITFYNNGNWRN